MYGLIRKIRVFLDTEKVAALDAQLAGGGLNTAAAPDSGQADRPDLTARSV